jgi:hypothetical protein
MSSSLGLPVLSFYLSNAKCKLFFETLSGDAHYSWTTGQLEIGRKLGKFPLGDNPPTMADSIDLSVRATSYEYETSLELISGSLDCSECV